MSRKSRQKKGRSLLAKLPPVWVLIPMLIIGLGMGILCVTMPWFTPPTPYEDTIPLSATMTEVEGEYRYHRKHRELEDIYLYFEDHERLIIYDVIANETLLDKLEAYPAGTIFDMRLKPNGIDVMTLSVSSVDILSYEAACQAIRVNNIFGIAWGIFSLAVAGYAAWGLCMTWKYRRLTPLKGAPHVP